MHAGLLNLTDVSLPEAAIFYLCGPLPFMTAVRSALLERGVAAHDIQFSGGGIELGYDLRDNV